MPLGQPLGERELDRESLPGRVVEERLLCEFLSGRQNLEAVLARLSTPALETQDGWPRCRKPSCSKRLLVSLSMLYVLQVSAVFTPRWRERCCLGEKCSSWLWPPMA